MKSNEKFVFAVETFSDDELEDNTYMLANAHKAKVNPAWKDESETGASGAHNNKGWVIAAGLFIGVLAFGTGMFLHTFF
ncbi:TPA: hypothetical protein ACK3Q6_002606 [Burkholderia cepacia]|uniref:Uncharacterized protein n=1 Tax=Burkholderia cenocepacia TaxID=95486 RepID=A0ABD4UDE7_9BURK|nr:MULTISPECIES: hypothetical protein [Burkholderia]HDR9763693.1 hypothetical protein [Burkholderia cepacia ATCC 25416]MCA8361285.1 hypothetical protein [Burkholderia cepacia]MCW3498744.1 hypothetical protein [Burkholderia cenocepacia]MCW3506168.1 hypothetical protein [Burkholderia cenocepacia]MCW3513897.1 hypothetical protein [Burkholderia cenocepacia]